jgi:hypothetical protein
VSNNLVRWAFVLFAVICGVFAKTQEVKAQEQEVYEFVYPVQNPGAFSLGFLDEWHFCDNGGWTLHPSVDYTGSVGDDLMAIARGVVHSSQSNYTTTGYGIEVTLRHVLSDGTVVYSHYAHLNDLYVSPGESVESGQVIGALGRSGTATGPHLDFNIMVGETQAWPPCTSNNAVLTEWITNGETPRYLDPQRFLSLHAGEPGFAMFFTDTYFRGDQANIYYEADATFNTTPGMDNSISSYVIPEDWVTYAYEGRAASPPHFVLGRSGADLRNAAFSDGSTVNDRISSIQVVGPNVCAAPSEVTGASANCVPDPEDPADGGVEEPPTCNTSATPVVLVQRSSSGDICQTVSGSVNNVSSLGITRIDEVYINASNVVWVRGYQNINPSWTATHYEISSSTTSFNNAFSAAIRIHRSIDECGDESQDGIYLKLENDVCVLTTSDITDLRSEYGNLKVKAGMAKGNYKAKLFEEPNRSGRTQEVHGGGWHNYEPFDYRHVDVWELSTCNWSMGHGVFIEGDFGCVWTDADGTTIDLASNYGNPHKFTVRSGWNIRNCKVSDPYQGDQCHEYGPGVHNLDHRYRWGTPFRHNDAPNATSIISPTSGVTFTLGSNVEICWHDNGDPNGHVVSFDYKLVKGEQVVVQKQRQLATCYTATDLSAGDYSFTVTPLDWGSTFDYKHGGGDSISFTVVDPNAPVQTILHYSDSSSPVISNGAAPKFCWDSISGISQYAVKTIYEGMYMDIGEWVTGNCWELPEHLAYSGDWTWKLATKSHNGHVDQGHHTIKSFSITGENFGGSPMPGTNPVYNEPPLLCQPEHVSGITHYKFKVYTVYGKKVADSGWLTDTCWQMPSQNPPYNSMAYRVIPYKLHTNGNSYSLEENWPNMTFELRPEGWVEPSTLHYSNDTSPELDGLAPKFEWDAIANASDYIVTLWFNGHALGNQVYTGGITHWEMPTDMNYNGNWQWRLDYRLHGSSEYYRSQHKRSFTIVNGSNAIYPVPGEDLLFNLPPTICQPRQGSWVTRYAFRLNLVGGPYNGQHAGTSAWSTSNCWQPNPFNPPFNNMNYKVLPRVKAWNGKTVEIPWAETSFRLSSATAAGEHSQNLPIQGLLPEPKNGYVGSVTDEWIMSLQHDIYLPYVTKR